MPISADRFEALDEDDGGPTPGTNAHAILSFLEENADRAFTQSEIAEAMEIPLGSVGPTLVRLREDGRVDHRGTYWRVSDHVSSVDVATEHASATADSHDETAFDHDAWREHAVDPRDDRE